jgi:hypothetical protein|tara:strand:+ start:279 stop:608 length:330 start_codon:yes stop_codon:yes gene_type:complete
MGRVKELSMVEIGDQVAVRLFNTCPPNMLGIGRVVEVDEHGFGGIVNVYDAGRQELGTECEIDLAETALIRGWVTDPSGGLMPNPNRKIKTLQQARYKDAHPEDPTIPF